MLIKFRPGPAAQASAVSSFASFDGLKRSCAKYEKHKGVLRCAKFRKGKGHPVCDSRLVDGGRSPGLVRRGKCKYSAARKAKRGARRSKRSRK